MKHCGKCKNSRSSMEPVCDFCIYYHDADISPAPTCAGYGRCILTGRYTSITGGCSQYVCGNSDEARRLLPSGRVRMPPAGGGRKV